jgi:AcrR family transcriptional regulator
MICQQAIALEYNKRYTMSMNEGRIDRRVRRTNRLLGEALIVLAHEKGYEAVTIKEITDRADVAYMTFFRHFRDKDDLLTRLVEDITVEIEELARSEGRIFSHEAEGLLLFEHASEHPALYRVLFSAASARRRVTERLAALIQQHMSHHVSRADESEIPIEIAAQHVAASLLALVEWWLTHDMPYPAEKMAHYYAQMIVAPALPAAALNTDPL